MAVMISLIFLKTELKSRKDIFSELSREHVAFFSSAKTIHPSEWYTQKITLNGKHKDHIFFPYQNFSFRRFFDSEYIH